jgi:hypothetical protein
VRAPVADMDHYHYSYVSIPSPFLRAEEQVSRFLSVVLSIRVLPGLWFNEFAHACNIANLAQCDLHCLNEKILSVMRVSRSHPLCLVTDGDIGIVQDAVREIAYDSRMRA